MKYRPDLALFLGSQNAAIFYQRILDVVCYFEERSILRKDGFVYKAHDELTKETGLSRQQQRSARRLLVKEGWLEEKVHRANGHPTVHYKPLIQVIDPDGHRQPNRMVTTNHSSGSRQPITNTRPPLDNSLERALLINKLSM